MITKLILSSILTFLISSGMFLNSDQTAINTMNAETTQEVDVVKAIMFNGEILPRIDLPVVEIKGELNTDVMVKAIVFDGQIMPLINLPEVVVTPNS